MIPKVIHYCWFGNKPISSSLKVCMNSWKEILPDYEWRLWDLNSFDVNSLPWTKEAYEHIKVTEATVICRNGINRLYVYGMSPAIVIERILLWKDDTKLPESYLGPRESWRKY